MMISEFLALRARTTTNDDTVLEEFTRDATDLLREYVGDEDVSDDIDATLERVLELPAGFARAQALRELAATVEIDLAHRGFGVVRFDGYMIAATWDAASPAETT